MVCFYFKNKKQSNPLEQCAYDVDGWIDQWSEIITALSLGRQIKCHNTSNFEFQITWMN